MNRRAGAFTRNESEADKSSRFEIRRALCTLCHLHLKIYVKEKAEWYFYRSESVTYDGAKNPENNVQLIVTQTAAPFCSPAPVKENPIEL